MTLTSRPFWGGFRLYIKVDAKLIIKATLHKARASCFARILLAYFRHLAQVLLGRRQPVDVELVQSDEKPDIAICTQALCGVTLKNLKIFGSHTPCCCAAL